MLVRTKSIVTSKTFWAGAAVVVLAAAEATMGAITSAGLELPTVMGLLGALIVGLRWVTKQPVSLKGGDVQHVDDGTPPRGL